MPEETLHLALRAVAAGEGPVAFLLPPLAVLTRLGSPDTILWSDLLTSHDEDGHVFTLRT